MCTIRWAEPITKQPDTIALISRLNLFKAMQTKSSIHPIHFIFIEDRAWKRVLDVYIGKQSLQ